MSRSPLFFERPGFGSSPNSQSDLKQVTKYDLGPSKTEISIPDPANVLEGWKPTVRYPKGCATTKPEKHSEQQTAATEKHSEQQTGHQQKHSPV